MGNCNCKCQGDNLIGIKCNDNPDEKKVTFSEHAGLGFWMQDTNKRERGSHISGYSLRNILDFTPPVYPKTDEAKELIERALNENSVLSCLSSQEHRLIIDAMSIETMPAGTIIIKQADIGDFFYVIDSGTVSVVNNEETVGKLERGSSFGEFALLYQCPRSATCIAMTECVLYKLDQKVFRHVLANQSATEELSVMQAMANAPVFSKLDRECLMRIAKSFTVQSFKEGETIIKRGDVGKGGFYIVQEGQICIKNIRSSYVDQNLGKGDFFGEGELLTGEPRAADVVATTNCTCFCLSRALFEKTMGPLHELIEEAARKRVLMGVPAFACMSIQPDEWSRLSSLMTQVECEKGKALIVEGKELDHSLYIIQSGKFSVSSSKEANLENYCKSGYASAGVPINSKEHFLAKGAYFGTTAPLPGITTSAVSIIAAEDSACNVLTKTDAERVLGSLGRFIPTSKSHSSFYSNCLHGDFRKIRILGVGADSRVWFVQHKKTEKYYALKILDKQHLIDQKTTTNIFRERNIMNVLSSPFICNLLSMFQCPESVFMLLDVHRGGELFSIIHNDRRPGVPNEDAKFYATCVLEAIRHMHSRNICYRDLRPENVMINSSGYCVLIDFFNAKTVTDKTYTLCGNVEYLAPEMLFYKGYTKKVDIWALGVLIFEMLFSFSPFYSVNRDTILKQIVELDFYFPDEDGVTIDEAARDLIEKLLVLRPVERLGSLKNGINDIFDHDWFRSIDQEKVFSREMTAPWIPAFNCIECTSHFDTYEYLEKGDSIVKPPLTDEQQALFKFHRL